MRKKQARTQKGPFNCALNETKIISGLLQAGILTGSIPQKYYHHPRPAHSPHLSPPTHQIPLPPTRATSSSPPRMLHEPLIHLASTPQLSSAE